PQAPRDRLQDVSRWLTQAAFDLTQIGIRYARAFAELAQREPRIASLIANELAEIVQPRVERLSGFGFGHAVPATCLAAISRSSASTTPCSCGRADESSVSNSRSRSRLGARSSADSSGRFASVVSATSCSRPSGQCNSIAGASGGGTRVSTTLDRPDSL